MLESKTIRTALKGIGYNSRMVSVKERRGGLNWAFDLTIRDESVDAQKVKELAKSFERVDRDESTLEVLSGSQVFLFVQNKNGRLL